MTRRQGSKNQIYRRGKLKNRIPQTRRFCLFCDKETTFEYIKATDHSQCIECGMTIARRIENVR